MTFKPSVLCPIDFSESSRGALRYAAMIAGHCGSSLTLLAVNDPVFVEAAELTGGHAHLADETRREMERFHRQALGRASNTPVDLQFEIASGKPAPEILRVARERRSDLIVMASHGSTGFRKLFFGSTTERVLRETGVPVLVTPGDAAPLDLEDVRKTIRRVLVPVDLTAASSHQLDVA
jgi:nucleotide-binding universal stress UspA family protein